jgi:multiple antibiotic resistance protein
MGVWFLTCLVSLLAVLNPVGAVPLLLTMTTGDPPERRRRTALIAAATQTVCLVAVAVGGSTLFAFFHISVDSFRIAGGALLFLIAIDMVKVNQLRHKATEAEVQEGVARTEVGIIPLGIPMLSGPGAIATAVSLAGQAPHLSLEMAVLLAAVLAAGLVTALLLLAATRIERWLTPTVLGIASRLVGLLLAAIAVQMLVTGVQNSFGLVPAVTGR